MIPVIEPLLGQSDYAAVVRTSQVKRAQANAQRGIRSTEHA